MVVFCSYFHRCSCVIASMYQPFPLCSPQVVNNSRCELKSTIQYCYKRGREEGADLEFFAILIPSLFSHLRFAQTAKMLAIIPTIFTLLSFITLGCARPAEYGEMSHDAQRYVQKLINSRQTTRLREEEKLEAKIRRGTKTHSNHNALVARAETSANTFSTYNAVHAWQNYAGKQCI